MKFVTIAELMLIFLANGMRFYAVKRYIDYFISKDKKHWEHTGILYVLACVGTFAISMVFVSPGVKYSLQGTTQGRYLTGGVPPVRFSM